MQVRQFDEVGDRQSTQQQQCHCTAQRILPPEMTHQV